MARTGAVLRILLTGACGYVASRLAARLRECMDGAYLVGIDNLSRRGSETNVANLRPLLDDLRHGDVRQASDLEPILGVDWVIDCAANPSVLAGVSGPGGPTPQQLVENNLIGTLNILELCRRQRAGLVLLSTSRVYSIDALRTVPLIEGATRFSLGPSLGSATAGLSSEGIGEEFSTAAPVSLYGATKLASETMALEYGSAFELPVWINRCGVIGGPGQFGRVDQGIFSYWVYSCLLGRPLRYIGFGGSGKQVRDCVTAEDVADLVIKQVRDPGRDVRHTVNVGGGVQGALSLVELTQLCHEFLRMRCEVGIDLNPRPFDVPFFVTDTRLAREAWSWAPTKDAAAIVSELCQWATANRDFVARLME